MSTFLPRKSSPKALKVDVHLVKCTALGFLLACYLAYPSIRPRRRPSETFHEIANMSEDGDHVGRQGATSESTDNKMFSAIYGIRMKPDSRDGRIRPCLKYTDKDRQMHQYVRAHLERMRPSDVHSSVWSTVPFMSGISWTHSSARYLSDWENGCKVLLYLLAKRGMNDETVECRYKMATRI